MLTHHVVVSEKIMSGIIFFRAEDLSLDSIFSSLKGTWLADYLVGTD